MSLTTVIGYSRSHFDPDRVDVLHSTSSAAALASAIYDAAVSETDRVVYVDAQQPGDWPDLDHVDFLISIESGFMPLVRKYRPARTLLFAVNQEAQSSVKKWFRPIDEGMLPIASILGAYELHSRDPRPAIAADGILLVGDNRTFGTYVRHRSAQDVHVVSYGEGGVGRRLPREKAQDLIVFPASSVGVRKGLDLARSLCEVLEQRRCTSVKVAVVGAPSNNYWASEMAGLSERYRTIFQFAGWLKLPSREYDEIMSRAACAVVASREEGLVGTAVEAIRSGIPVFASSECGLGVRPSPMVLESDRSTWPTRVVDFCLEQKARTRPYDPELLEWDSYRSAVQVTSAVRRFLCGNSVVPQLWVNDTEVSVVVSRSADVDATPVGEWLDARLRAPDLSGLTDGVICAVARLEADAGLEFVEVMPAELDEMPAVESLAVGSVINGFTLLTRYTKSSGDRGQFAIVGMEGQPKAAISRHTSACTRTTSRMLQHYSVNWAWRVRPVRLRVRALVGRAVKRVKRREGGQ